jgi:hypothetical protein
MTPSKVLAALCALATLAGAQTTITNAVPAVLGFLDLTTNGGTSVVPAPSVGSEHNIVTTVGNFLFPAGDVRIANDGVAIAGITSGDVSSTNVAIPAVGFPAGIPAGAAAILPWWDFTCPAPLPNILGTPPPASILWKENAGVLYIAWIGEYPACNGLAGKTITFEIQVFGAPAPGSPWIQILYPDTVFDPGNPLLPPPFGPVPPHPCNDGSCATIGYVAGPFGTNAQWTPFDVNDGMVLSIFPPTMELTASSPLGSGSLKLDIAHGPPSGTYFFVVTLAPGAYPNGWLFGLDISYADLGVQLLAGFPFSGPLDAFGSFSLGPLPGVPPLTIFAIAFGFLAGSPVPSTYTSAISYPIP